MEMPSTAYFWLVRFCSSIFLSRRSPSLLQDTGRVQKEVDYLDLSVVQSAGNERLGEAVNFTVWDVENVGDTFSKTEDERPAVGGGLHDLEVVDTLQLDVVKEV